MSNITFETHRQAPPEWDKYVMDHPDHKLYHGSEWCQMITEIFGHSTSYHVLKEADEVVGILPLTHFKSMLFGKMAISLPFINYGGPLFSNGAGKLDLHEHLAAVRNDGGFKLVELRLDTALETDMQCKKHKVTFFLDLPADPDELMASFKAKLRSQIRRPTKENMTARFGSMELLDDFYYVFTANMRDLGTPPLPKRFFQAILERFSEHAYIVVVYTEDNRPAASSFLIKYGQTMEIPWASSLREFNRFSPNMLLYWESLKGSIERGCNRFDFGRCTPDSGTYRFKKQWGAVESPLFWYYVMPDGESVPEMNPKNPKYDMIIKVWQKMPLALTNSVGPMIIKHIP